MECAADGIGKRVHRGAACVSEGDAGIVGSQNEFFQILESFFLALFHDFLVAVHDHLDGFQGIHLRERRRLWRQIGLDGVDQSIHGACHKELVGKSLDGFRYENRDVRIGFFHSDSFFRMQGF
ncbi:hypothetical protein SDC9_180552 [bioreactor metagenome]|uniref:Uncharacterized protein n=1 Tax=bioreactor metagenome TaxID=1076179 RepID=A0A645H4U7_9ZZZZ